MASRNVLEDARATEQLGRYVSGLRFDQLPEEVVEAAKRTLRDALGVGLFAGHLEWSEAVRTYVEEMRATGRATVWATGFQTAPALAAMANGTAVHGIEMDDRSAALDLHNGAATIPAAVASAEYAQANGPELLVGIVAGYEVAFRLARATRGCIGPRFHGNSIRNGFGATAAAAKIIRLDFDHLLYAFGLAGCFASGLRAAREYSAKRLQGGGWPAHNGVTAAMLAARGLTASSSILEEPAGVCASFSTYGEPDLGALTRGLGDGFEILTWEAKPYAAWGGSHSSLDAVRQIQTDYGLGPSDIDTIEIGVSEKNLPETKKNWPDTIMKAQRHLQFLVATQFFQDLRNPDVWTDELLGDEAIASLARRISAGIDQEIQRNFQSSHDHGGVRMTVRTIKGQRLEVKIRYATGTAQNPMSDESLREKFRLLAGKALTSKRVHRLEEYVDSLPTLERPVDFAALLTP